MNRNRDILNRPVNHIAASLSLSFYEERSICEKEAGAARIPQGSLNPK